jgi:hypothetical protein
VLIGNKYSTSLNDISKIINFSKEKKLFTQNNTIYNRSDDVAMGNVENFLYGRIIPPLEGLKLHLRTLGGKQLLSALYKVSMTKIERNVNQMKEH